MKLHIPDKTIAMVQIITSDGALVYHSKIGSPFRITILEDQTVVGLAEQGQALIEQFSVNEPTEIEVRRQSAHIRAIRDGYLETIRPPIGSFCKALHEAAQLNRGAEVHSRWTQEYIRRLVYSNVITALETFLSDFLIAWIRTDTKKAEALAEKSKSIKETKYTLSTLFSSAKSPLDLLEDILGGLTFHNFTRADELYKAAFNFGLPKWGTLVPAIENRHDIVHRNGVPKGKNKPLVFSRKEVLGLISEAQKFVLEALHEIN